MTNRITVNVTLSLTIDADNWDLAFGTGTSAKLVREDVKSYFLNIAQQCAASEEEAIVKAEVR